MASDKSNPQKGQGNSKPDHQQASEMDAADVDWMIISDISTRIGGSSQPKPASNQASGTTSSQILNKQANDSDLEDLEWLRSLGLDEEIERSPSSKNTSNSQGSNSVANDNDVENIDWLIVTDLKTRMDDSDIKFTANSPPQNIAQSTNTPQTSIQPNILADDLGIDGLDFLDNSDFANLDSLDFDSSDTFEISGLQDLQNEVENTDNIQDLDGFFDSSFDESSSLNDNNNWANLLADSAVDASNHLSNDQPSLNITSESFDIPTQISGFISSDEPENDDNLAPNSDQLFESIDSIDQESVQEEPLDDFQDFLGGDWSLSDEVASSEIVAELDVDHELQNAQEPELALEQDLLLTEQEEVKNVLEDAGNQLDDGFGEVRSLESFNSDAIADEVWSSSLPSLDADISISTIDDPFGDYSASGEPNALSSTEINDAFGTLDDWESTSQSEQIGLEENSDFELPNDFELPSIGNIEQAFDSEFDLASEQSLGQNSELASTSSSTDDWSAELEAEIDNGNDTAWDDPLIEITEDHSSLESLESGLTENALNFDISDTSDSSDWAISNNLTESMAGSASIAVDQPSVDQQQIVEFDDQSDDYVSANFESQEFEPSENPTALSSDWGNLNESIADQVTNLELADVLINPDIASPVDLPVESSDWNASNAEPIVTQSDDDLESLIDENFDLAAFDEDSLIETTLSKFKNTNIPTTLTPNRAASIAPPEEVFPANFPSPPPLNAVVSPEDFLDEAMAHDLLNESYEEEDFYQGDVANDLMSDHGLADYNSVADVVDDSLPEPVTLLTPPLNSAPPANFGKTFEANTQGDRDFLDDFDLASIDPQLGDDFDSGFGSSPISTGLTPPPPPIIPTPPIAPPIANQEITAPSINNPPPPPFLPPLPPKRNPTQGKTNNPPPSAHNIDSQSQSQNTMGKRRREEDFDRFHAQPNQQKDRKSINAIDDSWSELLDADTVLSGGLRSPSSFTTATPSGGITGNTSQGRDRNTDSRGSQRREIDLPDFNELGIEVHDDNTDWSGLLDSGDLSDSITTISKQSTQLPSRGRTTPTTSPRSDATSNSETKEIPRDRRRPMPSFSDTTQASMGAPPDQIDFNRFTEDNYSSYGGYEPPAIEPEVAAKKSPQKPKMTMPSVSLESLWQDYLKFPAIGLAAIGGVFLLYSLLNRPIFDMGLRWGIFKDASGKDFTNADFKGAKLDNVDFSKAILTGAKMQDASLVGANFQEANLDGVNFTKANLNRARLIKASVIWAEFNNAQMSLVDLAFADLTRSNFASAKMEGANLKDSKIGAQGTEKATRFSSTVLLAWQIVNEPREGRNLAEQDLSGLNLSFTSLKRANLSNSKLNYTDLTGTDLRGANLTGSQVNGANWSGAKLTGINLTDVTLDKSKLPKTDEETICPNGKKGPCKF